MWMSGNRGGPVWEGQIDVSSRPYDVDRLLLATARPFLTAESGLIAAERWQHRVYRPRGIGARRANLAAGGLGLLGCLPKPLHLSEGQVA
jgi:hypothetical protein